MKNIPFDIAVAIGGMFLYGAKNMLAKWLVMLLIVKPGKKLLVKTEHELKLYHQMHTSAHEWHRNNKSKR